MELTDAGHGEVGDAVAGVRCLGLAGDVGGEERGPAGEDLVVPRRVELARHGLVGLSLLVLQKRLKGRQVWCDVGRHQLLEAGEAEQVDIEIACETRDLAEPAEVAGVARDDTVGEHALDLGQRGARPADGHAEVVEELAVEVVAHAVFVAPQGAEHVPQDLAGGLVRPHLGLEDEVELAGVVPRLATQGVHGLFKQGELGDGVNVEQRGDDLVGVLFVSADRGDLEPAPQGCRVAGLIEDLELGQLKVGHRLVACVAYCQRDALAPNPNRREQRPHLEDVFQHLTRAHTPDVGGPARRTRAAEDGVGGFAVAGAPAEASALLFAVEVHRGATFQRRQSKLSSHVRWMSCGSSAWAPSRRARSSATWSRARHRARQSVGATCGSGDLGEVEWESVTCSTHLCQRSSLPTTSVSRDPGRRRRFGLPTPVERRPHGRGSERKFWCVTWIGVMASRASATCRAMSPSRRAWWCARAWRARRSPHHQGAVGGGVAC